MGFSYNVSLPSNGAGNYFHHQLAFSDFQEAAMLGSYFLLMAIYTGFICASALGYHNV